MTLHWEILSLASPNFPPRVRRVPSPVQRLLLLLNWRSQRSPPVSPCGRERSTEVPAAWVTEHRKDQGKGRGRRARDEGCGSPLKVVPSENHRNKELNPIRNLALSHYQPPSPPPPPCSCRDSRGSLLPEMNIARDS